MKKIILIIACLVSVAVTSAQSPLFQWAKSMGGISVETGNSIALDGFGNVYTTGSFYKTVDFDPGPGTFNLTAHAFRDIFILKLDAVGNFVWAKNLGGTSINEGVSIAVDASGNVYTAGTFKDTTDFDPGPGIFNLITTGINHAPNNGHAFILKLDTSGNFVWAKSLGGNLNTVANSIAVDKSGNLYTTGYFDGIADFDPGAGVFSLASSNLPNIFISKLDVLGNFVWAKNLGGTSIVKGHAIAVDASGNIYITGEFQLTVDFDPGPGIFNLIAVGGIDIFISKLDATGNFIWAKNMGGAENEWVSSIAIDEGSNVYTTGFFSGTTDFDPGTGVVNLISASIDYDDIFVSKLDANGNFAWAKSMGGTLNDRSLFITLDASANVYTTGYFVGTADFDPGPETFNLLSAYSDVFISKLNTSGNFVWAKNIRGSLFDVGNAIAVDVSGNVYTTGRFEETADFDPGIGTFNLTSAGASDVFVHKMSIEPLTIKKSGTVSNITIYPNPTNGLFYIVVSEPINNIYIEIYNSLGILIYRQTSIKEHNTIELVNQNNGLYFVKVMNDNKILAAQKIIKQ